MKRAHTYWLLMIVGALAELTPSHPPCAFFGARSTFHKTYNFSWFTFRHSAFDFGLRKKQIDSGVGFERSTYPGVVLEVGDSESLTQLKIDAKFWLEDLPKVCQFLP
jgi:hypothetical protein